MPAPALVSVLPFQALPAVTLWSVSPTPTVNRPSTVKLPCARLLAAVQLRS
ncbi:hypothetical protein WJ970_10955 [Achromobacter xylosoxidans]